MKILLFLSLVISIMINIILVKKIRKIAKELESSQNRFRNKYVDDGYSAY